MIPHPMQVMICDEIVLVIHGRLVDVVTSNIELAIRDEKEQRDYYKLFNINSVF